MNVQQFKRNENLSLLKTRTPNTYIPFVGFYGHFSQFFSFSFTLPLVQLFVPTFRTFSAAHLSFFPPEHCVSTYEQSAIEESDIQCRLRWRDRERARETNKMIRR